MPEVPNRAGDHRALLPATQSMYANMPNHQLHAIHSQAKFILEHGKNEDLKPKFAERLKYTTSEMKTRGV